LLFRKAKPLEIDWILRPQEPKLAKAVDALCSEKAVEIVAWVLILERKVIVYCRFHEE
jgi:hypothetical protein